MISWRLGRDDAQYLRDPARMELAHMPDSVCPQPRHDYTRQRKRDYAQQGAVDIAATASPVRFQCECRHADGEL